RGQVTTRETGVQPVSPPPNPSFGPAQARLDIGDRLLPPSGIRFGRGGGVNDYAVAQRRAYAQMPSGALSRGRRGRAVPIPARSVGRAAAARDRSLRLHRPAARRDPGLWLPGLRSLPRGFPLSRLL